MHVLTLSETGTTRRREALYRHGIDSSNFVPFLRTMMSLSHRTIARQGGRMKLSAAYILGRFERLLRFELLKVPVLQDTLSKEYPLQTVERLTLRTDDSDDNRIANCIRMV